MAAAERARESKQGSKSAMAAPSGSAASGKAETIPSTTRGISLVGSKERKKEKSWKTLDPSPVAATEAPPETKRDKREEKSEAREGSEEMESDSRDRREERAGTTVKEGGGEAKRERRAGRWPAASRDVGRGLPDWRRRAMSAMDRRFGGWPPPLAAPAAATAAMFAGDDADGRGERSVRRNGVSRQFSQVTFQY